VTCFTTIEWMRRTQAMTPLTPQEEAVKRILLDRRLPFSPHHVFDLKLMGGFCVDFLVFHRPGLVLECTACGTKRGRAISEVRRRAAFMDYRFSALKSALPDLRCGAFIEAPHEDSDRLEVELARILRNSDFFASTGESLQQCLPKVQ
jgi:hypothetical protein